MFVIFLAADNAINVIFVHTFICPGDPQQEHQPYEEEPVIESVEPAKLAEKGNKTSGYKELDNEFDGAEIVRYFLVIFRFYASSFPCIFR